MDEKVHWKCKSTLVHSQFSLSEKLTVQFCRTKRQFIILCIAFIKFKQSVQDAPFLKSIIVAVSWNFHMKAELFDKQRPSSDHWSRENADQLIKWNAVSDGKKNPVSIWNGKEYLVCLGRISDQVLLPPASPSPQLDGCSDRRLGISSTSLFAHKIWRRYIASG